MATQLFAAGDPDVLYLVDFSGYVLRAYHAIGQLSSPSGEPTNAVYGTVTMLERLVRERQPALLAIAMDSGRDTFRRDIYPEYKATRPAAPEDLKLQLTRCREIVEAFAVPILQQTGVEADDLIACAVEKARSHGLKVVIVAADKDLMQLVAEDVVMWDTMRDRVFGRPEVEERFGVKVEQVRDLLALMGDSSDNIPGVPHVGPKTARDLLVEFGTLEGVFEHLDAIPKKGLRKNLEEHQADARLSQTLVTLRTDCPISFELEDLRWGGRDVARLRRIYTELGFTRQLQALDMAPKPHPATAATSPALTRGEPVPTAASDTVFDVILDVASLEKLAAHIREVGRFALSAETISESRLVSALIGIGLSVTPGRAHYVPVGHRAIGAPAQLRCEDVARVLGPVLADPAIDKLAHSLKREAVALGWNGMAFAGGRLDAELESYLLDPEGRHGIEEIAQRELGVLLTRRAELTKAARGRGIDFDQVPIEEASRFAGARAEAAHAACTRLKQRVDDEGLASVLDAIEIPLSSILSDMELRGVLVDTSRLKELGGACDKELERLELETHQAAGRRFNLSSPRQLETLLFDELGLSPLRRTKTSRSTDAETLEALADSHPLPRLILEHRQLAKLKGTYIEALPQLVHPKTGRIHTSWQQAVAATGRISSTDPNLQNIPIRSELGREIRSAFVAPEGHEIVSADYSQIELRVLAHLSKDEVLLDAFRSDQDVHSRTAMEIFDVSASALTPEMRRRAKAVNFGVIYGQGDSGLAKSLGISKQEAGSFIAAYFRRHAGVQRFMNATLDGARASESVKTLLGRRRLVPDIKSANRAKRLAAERVAMNAPIQGTAADILKLAMLRFREPPSPGARMVLTVHDELVFEVPSAEVSAAIERIRHEMENAISLDVPLRVDVGHGPNWKDAH